LFCYADIIIAHFHCALELLLSVFAQTADQSLVFLTLLCQSFQSLSTLFFWYPVHPGGTSPLILGYQPSDFSNLPATRPKTGNLSHTLSIHLWV
jgi:hypothetical protein